MGFTRKKYENQKLPVEIYSVFVAFGILCDPSACTSIEDANLGKMERAFVLLILRDK